MNKPHIATRWFSHFWKAHPCDQHEQTDRQTETTLCVTSLSTGHIYAVQALQHKK